MGYTTFRIPKRGGGFRRILAPDEELKAEQRQALKTLYEWYSPSPWAHGFVRGRSILSNARQHLGARAVINLDLVNFFPSISKGRVKRALTRARPRPPRAKLSLMGRVRRWFAWTFRGDWVRSLLETCTHEGCLPQGAPSSPALSNLAAKALDFRLARFAQENGLVYTRYADDLTFSTKGNQNPSRHMKQIYTIIKGAGFRVNRKKVRIAGPGAARVATGLCVGGERPTVSRRRRRLFRARLHKLAMALKDHSEGTRTADLAAIEKELQSCIGYIAFLKAMMPEAAARFQPKLDRLTQDVDRITLGGTR